MTYRVWSIEGNGQRLDGGAMFGNAPRPLWQRWIAPDERHRIPLACRALLVEEPSGRRVLFETGIGDFFPPDLRDRYGVQGAGHQLLASLRQVGVEPEQVDVVVLSHLHFDHAGGLLESWREGSGRPSTLVFPRAQLVVSAPAWERARAPHVRDQASFIAELPLLLESTGRLEIVSQETSETLGPAYRLLFSEGHTPGMLLTEVPGEQGPLLFAGDLVPGRAWLHLPLTMGYDRCPERLVDEKGRVLESLYRRGGRIFFTHDPEVAAARIDRDDRGRFVAGEVWDSLVGQFA